MDIATVDNYDEISTGVRGFVSERFYELEKTLRPWIDGSMGEIAPAHLNAYISILKELARLWEANKRPRGEDEQRIPASEVEALLAAAEARMREELEDAVAQAEQRVRMEAASAETRSIESAKGQVLARMGQLRGRQAGSN